MRIVEGCNSYGICCDAEKVFAFARKGRRIRQQGFEEIYSLLYLAELLCH